MDAFAEEHKLRAEKEALEAQVREMEDEVRLRVRLGGVDADVRDRSRV